MTTNFGPKKVLCPKCERRPMFITSKQCIVCFHYSIRIDQDLPTDCPHCRGFAYEQKGRNWYPCHVCLGSGRNDIIGTRNPNECVRTSSDDHDAGFGHGKKKKRLPGRPRKHKKATSKNGRVRRK